jgi:hypothetical protein
MLELKPQPFQKKILDAEQDFVLAGGGKPSASTLKNLF